WCRPVLTGTNEGSAQAGGFPGQFFDPAPFAGGQQVLRSEPRTPDAADVGQCQVARRVLRVDAAGRAEPQLRERAGDRFQEADPAALLGGEELHRRQAAFGQPHRFGNGAGSGQERNPGTVQSVQQALGGAGGDQVLGSRRDRRLDLLRLRDGPGSHHHLRNRAGDPLDGVHRGGGPQGDFDGPDAAAEQSLRQRNRLRGVVECHRRDDRGQLEYFSGVHGAHWFFPVNAGCCAWGADWAKGERRALAPWSARPTACRKVAKSSLPAPNWACGGDTGSRAVSSSAGTSTSKVPSAASSRMVSPSRTRDSGPPAAASGVSWIADRKSTRLNSSH